MKRPPIRRNFAKRNVAGATTGAARSVQNRRRQNALLAMHAAIESDAFLKAAIRLLQALVTHDVTYVMLHYFGEFGRHTEAWGTDGREFSEEWLRGHHANNPAFPVLVSQPGRKVLRLRDCFPDEKAMLRSRFFRDYMAPIDTRHAVALFFWNDRLNAIDCALALHRSDRMSDFDPEEIRAIERIYPHIETAFRRVAKLQNAAAIRQSLDGFLRDLPLPTVLLDWELRPVYYNRAALESCALWESGVAHKTRARDRLRVPAELLAVMREMKNRWGEALRSNPGSTSFETRVMTNGRNSQLRASITMTVLRSPHLGKPSFLLRFESTGSRGAARLSHIAMLSPREREVALLVCDGMSNQEIADSLGKSLATVKTELHSVFSKLEVKSRGQLIALLR
jgi:DNA-binding CsgD family transcriptional regulator/PAS domain-containing protein